MALENLDFLNLNSLRNYPIKEGVSKTSVDGGMVIPDDFLVELQLAATYDPAIRFYINRVSNFDDNITVEIMDQSNVSVGTFTVSVATHTQYKEYYLVASSDYSGATGSITVNRLDGMQGAPTGNHVFTLATAELEARTVIPALRGINRLIFQNASGETFSVTGDVQIVARTNLRFVDMGGNRVMLDAGEDLGLNVDCDGDSPAIKTINGIAPDSEGNFTLDFSDCATLEPIPANTGLILQDICCKPCQGCNDIEELTNRLTSLESQLLALRTYYTDLTTLFTQYKTTVDYTCDCPTE